MANVGMNCCGELNSLKNCPSGVGMRLTTQPTDPTLGPHARCFMPAVLSRFEALGGVALTYDAQNQVFQSTDGYPQATVWCEGGGDPAECHPHLQVMYADGTTAEFDFLPVPGFDEDGWQIYPQANPGNCQYVLSLGCATF